MMFTSPLFAAGAVKASGEHNAVEAGVSAAAEGDTSPGTTSSSTAAHASSDNTGAHIAVSGAGAVAVAILMYYRQCPKGSELVLLISEPTRACWVHTRAGPLNMMY